MRVAFLGNDAWSVPALEVLAGSRDLEIALVVTNPARPAGRGSTLTATPVAQEARRRGLSVVEVEGAGGGDALRAADPDVLAVVAYGQLLRPEILDLAPQGAVNLHFSLLPRWRGAAPVQHALLAGDTGTGVTTMRMDEGLDTGPILEQLDEPILPEDDAGTLGARLARLGADLLAHTLRSLGALVPSPQDAAAATSAPKLAAADRVLDWRGPVEDLVRRVKAFAPAPGARTAFRGRSLGVLSAEPATGSGTPGMILAVDDRGVVVAAGGGGIRLRTVAPEGRRHMSATDWANGARFAPGEALG